MKHNKKIIIGRKLQMIRKSLGLTQEQVAEQLDLAPRYISDIERDKTKGSLDTLVKLCNVYNVSPTFILKEYLHTTDYMEDDTLIGFYRLSESQKNIIRQLISYMNQNEKDS